MRFSLCFLALRRGEGGRFFARRTNKGPLEDQKEQVRKRDNRRGDAEANNRIAPEGVEGQRADERQEEMEEGGMEQVHAV